MASKSSWIALVAALGFSALLGGCGGGTRDLCREKKVVCDTPLSCDPSDGVCKCGGRGGPVCGEQTVCDPTTNTCLSTRCGDKDCRGGTSCDQNDGLCKCGGTGGAACSTGQVCNPSTKQCAPAADCSQIACPANQVCDTATRTCKCGTATCAAGDYCAVSGASKSCMPSLCSGVSCAPNNVCDPNDGRCKCNGAVCQSGQACACPGGSADGGTCAATARTCKAGSGCVGVTCPNNGTTCDPVDGQCKCGGPGGPVCTAQQICSQAVKQCQGGDQCKNGDGTPKLCLGGTSCDPEDGKCKCGGRGGVECKPAAGGEPAEVCVSTPFQQACRRPCTPHASDCPSGVFCYFDSTAATPVAYCAPNTDTKGEGDQCTTPTACYVTIPAPKSKHCFGLALGSSGFCRDYCDVTAGTAGCVQVPAHTCEQIANAPAGYGYCRPQ